jgi:hypothetical protein
MGTQASTNDSRVGYAFEDLTGSHIRSPNKAGAGNVAFTGQFVSDFRKATS